MLRYAPSHLKTILLTATIHTFIITVCYSQSSKEDSIKAVIHAETASYFAKDADGWQSAWQQDAKTTRTFVSNNNYVTATGWTNFGPDMVKYLKDNPKPTMVKFTVENLTIRGDENMAWVEYDQVSAYPPDTAVDHSHEQRAMVKENGKWLIASQVTYLKDTYNATAQAVEENLNTSGYNLIAMGKLQNAIDVFLLNVKLFPKSWNAFDSLGEAYAKAGNKKLAIENYKKSIALNPQNDGGKKALDTLMK
ncbi:MAG: tetratricopeptide repeat protein [Chitinophagaceae bacterium]